jgi:hypothetical protein
MKRVLVLVFLAAVISASSAFAEDPFVIMGGWSKKDLRSSSPTGQAAIQAMPSVSVENGVMLMSFNTDVSDLKVSVATSRGTVVYEASVSGNSGLTLPIRLGLQSGSYMLMLSHPKIGAMADKISVN